MPGHWTELLPHLFQLRAGTFYIQMASETDPKRVLSISGITFRPTVGSSSG